MYVTQYEFLFLFDCSSKFSILLAKVLLKSWRLVFSKLLTLSGQRSLSYRNQSIDLLCKSMDWFLYDKDLRHERVKQI